MSFLEGVRGGTRTACGRATLGELPTSRGLGEAVDALSPAPDGCCLDTEGAPWVADAIGGP